MHIKLKINNFEVPTHVYQESKAGLRQTGLCTSPSWELCELELDTLSELCDQFRKDVFAKANKIDPRKPV